MDGKTHNCIKTIYEKAVSSVVVNDRLTDWFLAQSGVGKGDSLSPMLFSIFINDLSHEPHELKKDLMVSDVHIPILIYTDDINILGVAKEDTQYQLDVLSQWCLQWGMKAHLTRNAFKKKTGRKLIDGEFYYQSIEIIYEIEGPNSILLYFTSFVY